MTIPYVRCCTAFSLPRWSRVLVLRACRRPGVVPGLGRRRCRVHGQARFWLLQQPAEFLSSRLVSELGLTPLPPAQRGATRARAHDLVPR